MTPPISTVTDLLRQRAGTAAGSTALMVDGRGSLSWEEWERRSNAMARGLADRGGVVGRRVALLFDNARWCDYALAYAAVQKAGAVAAPVGPGLSPLQVARVLGVSEAAATVCPTDLAPAEHPGWVATPGELELGQSTSSLGAPFPSFAADGEAEVLYEALPLGRPRATPVSHRQTGPGSLGLGLAAGTTLLHSFFLGTRHGQEALRLPLHTDGVVSVVAPTFDPDRFWAAIAEHGVTAVGLVPFVAKALLRAGGYEGHDLSAVRHLVTSGPLSEAAATGMAAVFPNASFAANDDAGAPAEVCDVVTAVFERVLGGKRVGAHDDFFQLGGTSLAATKVLSLVADAFEVELDAAAFFRSPTVAGVARAVATARAEPEQPSSAPPWAYSQEAYVWHEQLAPGCMNLPPVARRLSGRLDRAAMEGALTELARRHEPLRTCFELRRGRPVQRIDPPAPVRLPVVDLADLPADRQDEELAAAMRSTTGRPFDLVEGPMFRPSLLRLGPHEHVLIVPVNHTMWDDWSEVVFKQELSALYTAFAAGAESPLAEPVATFADVAREQRRLVAGRAGEAQMRYWRERLAGAPLAVQLPVGDPDLPPGAPHPPAGPVSLLLSPELTEKVTALARHHHASVFMVLLSAFSAVVQRHTGQYDLLVASVVANRDTPEAEALIGGMAKKVLVRLDLAGDPSFPSLLKRVRESLLGAVSNKDLPYETMLQEALGGPASQHGLTPQVTVLFQNLAAARARFELGDLESPRLDLRAAAAGRRHFAAARDPASAAATPWGAGLYLGTFVRVMVIRTRNGIALEAWGAFHPPAIERLLADMRWVLQAVVAGGDRPMSKLVSDREPEAGSWPLPHQGGDELDLGGFRIERSRLEAVLAGCPGVKDAAVALERAGGQGRLVAYVAPEGAGVGNNVVAPTLCDLRAWLWATLPGYAWPAAMRVVSAIPRRSDGQVDVDAIPLDAEPTDMRGPSRPDPPEAHLLAAAWAEVLGIEEVAAQENYWQNFPFLDALDLARRAGLGFTTRQVANNRTIETLAMAIASERLRRTLVAAPGHC